LKSNEKERNCGSFAAAVRPLFESGKKEVVCGRLKVTVKCRLTVYIFRPGSLNDKKQIFKFLLVFHY
jgi:hypothetical protein